MRDFDRPDELHYQFASGWIELGNWQEANAEIEELSPECKTHPQVLLLRCKIYLAAKRWDFLAVVAESLSIINGGNLTKDWRIPFRVACHYAQTGKLDLCETWFKRAMKVDEKAVQRIAIDEPELKPLWDSMSGTMWRRE